MLFLVNYTDETADNIYLCILKEMITRNHVTWGENKSDMSFWRLIGLKLAVFFSHLGYLQIANSLETVNKTVNSHKSDARFTVLRHS